MLLNNKTTFPGTGGFVCLKYQLLKEGFAFSRHFYPKTNCIQAIHVLGV